VAFDPSASAASRRPHHIGRQEERRPGAAGRVAQPDRVHSCGKRLWAVREGEARAEMVAVLRALDAELGDKEFLGGEPRRRRSGTLTPRWRRSRRGSACTSGTAGSAPRRNAPSSRRGQRGGRACLQQRVRARQGVRARRALQAAGARPADEIDDHRGLITRSLAICICSFGEINKPESVVVYVLNFLQSSGHHDQVTLGRIP
jgi:hypothetical protein